MGELKTVKREHRQDQKQAQHAQADGASEGDEQLFLCAGEADTPTYGCRGHVNAIAGALSGDLPW